MFGPKSDNLMGKNINEYQYINFLENIFFIKSSIGSCQYLCIQSYQPDLPLLYLLYHIISLPYLLPCLWVTPFSFIDFGLERLIEVSEQTKFPWLMSNVFDNETDRPLADGEITKIVNWMGWKIGLVRRMKRETRVQELRPSGRDPIDSACC